ncbi:agmatine deiminase family protein [Pelomyxa schiedti]|nr:agmatine deiminase family protein [Pelomyxa schiedti]
MIHALGPNVPVSLIVSTEAQKTEAEALLGDDAQYVTFYVLPHDDIWMRDFGPIFVFDDALQMNIITFDWTSWGYVNHTVHPTVLMDGDTGERVAGALGLPTYSAGMASEGGDRMFNGKGTMIANTYVETQRNPGLTFEEVDNKLKTLFSLKKIIWLDGALADDWQSFNILPGPIFSCMGTGGHVDEMVRFVNPTTVVVAELLEEEQDTPIGQITQATIDGIMSVLSTETDQDGTPLTILRITLPPTLNRTITPDDVLYSSLAGLNFTDGTTLDGSPVTVISASSYINYLVSNDVVLVGKYYKEGRDQKFAETDQNAVDVLSTALGRPAVQVEIEAVNFGGGGMNCISQQQPQART